MRLSHYLATVAIVCQFLASTHAMEAGFEVAYEGVGTSGAAGAFRFTTAFNDGARLFMDLDINACVGQLCIAMFMPTAYYPH